VSSEEEAEEALLRTLEARLTKGEEEVAALVKQEESCQTELRECEEEVARRTAERDAQVEEFQTQVGCVDTLCGYMSFFVSFETYLDPMPSRSSSRPR
jgi:chromosome segregation ATPase